MKPAAGRFVPSGVNAQSWIGFEHRIQERRFRALLDAIAAATARGDGVSARLALEEARELRPDAPELADAERRVALLPVAVAAASPGFFRSRTFGAVALLAVGVALLTALDAIRSSDAPSIDAQAALTPLDTTVLPLDVADANGAAAFEPEPAPVPEAPALPPAAADDPPEPLASLIGTNGLGGNDAPVERVRPAEREAPAGAPIEREPVERGTPAVRLASAASPAPDREPAVPDAVRPPEPPAGPRAEPLPRTEIADDPIVLPVPQQPRREAIVASPAVSRASRGAPLVPGLIASGSDSAREPAPGAAAIARDETLVSSVLDRYVRAYDTLDASAAREIWPSVDERALARAFAGLESQHLTFDDCSIDVRGEVANASCRGLASYVGKVGRREPRTEPRRWTFELRHDGEAWKIESAQAAALQ